MMGHEKEIGASMFSLFSQFPTELRHQIWRCALPCDVERALYFYQPGCWRSRYLTEVDEDYRDDRDVDYNLTLEFRHDHLSAVKFNVALFFVNREARNIALPWIRRQVLELQAIGEHERVLTFVRPFQFLCDSLYVCSDEFSGFLSEPDDRMEEPPLSNRSVTCPHPAIDSLAITQETLLTHGDSLGYIFDWYSCITKLLVIVKAPPELRREDDSKVQQRWEVESMGVPSLLWNPSSGVFERKGSQSDYDRDLMQLTEDQINGKLREELLERDDLTALEVEFVSAARK